MCALSQRGLTCSTLRDWKCKDPVSSQLLYSFFHCTHHRHIWQLLFTGNKCVRQIRNTLNIWYYVFPRGWPSSYVIFPIVFNRKKKSSASVWALWYNWALGGLQLDPGIPAADCLPSQNPFSLPLCFLGAQSCKVQCLLARSKESLESLPNRKPIWSLLGFCEQGLCVL